MSQVMISAKPILWDKVIPLGWVLWFNTRGFRTLLVRGQLSLTTDINKPVFEACPVS